MLKNRWQILLMWFWEGLVFFNSGKFWLLFWFQSKIFLQRLVCVETDLVMMAIHPSVDWSPRGVSLKLASLSPDLLFTLLLSAMASAGFSVMPFSCAISALKSSNRGLNLMKTVTPIKLLFKFVSVGYYGSIIRELCNYRQF